MGTCAPTVVELQLRHCCFQYKESAKTYKDLGICGIHVCHFSNCFHAHGRQIAIAEAESHSMLVFLFPYCQMGGPRFGPPPSKTQNEKILKMKKSNSTKSI